MDPRELPDDIYFDIDSSKILKDVSQKRIMW